DAIVLLERPLLGSMSVINIPDVGHDGGADVPPEAELVGAIAPPSFLAQAGYGPEQSRQVQSFIDQADRLAGRITKMIDRVDTSLEPALKDFRQFADDAASMSADVRRRLPDWSDDAGATLKNARDLSDRFGPMADKVDGGLDEARGVAR